jgi:hypothetical protein
MTPCSAGGAWQSGGGTTRTVVVELGIGEHVEGVHGSLTPGGIDDGVGNVGCGTTVTEVDEVVVALAEDVDGVTEVDEDVVDVAVTVSLLVMSHDWMAPWLEVTDPVCPGGVMANDSTPAAVWSVTLHTCLVEVNDSVRWSAEMCDTNEPSGAATGPTRPSHTWPVHVAAKAPVSTRLVATM